MRPNGAFAQLHDLHVQLHHAVRAHGVTRRATISIGCSSSSRSSEAEIEAAGGYAIDHKIDAMLHGLGFTDEQFSLKVTRTLRRTEGPARPRATAAGGARSACCLMSRRTISTSPGGSGWRQFLAEEYPGAVIVVSHDRWLLDRVVHRIIEVERGVIREYPGNYHDYVDLRRERQLTEARVYDKQQDRIKAGAGVHRSLPRRPAGHAGQGTRGPPRAIQAR